MYLPIVNAVVCLSIALTCVFKAALSTPSMSWGIRWSWAFIAGLAVLCAFEGFRERVNVYQLGVTAFCCINQALTLWGMRRPKSL